MTATATAKSYARLLSPSYWAETIFKFFYILIQHIIIWLFKPPPPPGPDYPKNPKGRIAVIGAGLTGVSSAAHAIAHGFDVVIYEQGDTVGGIWAHVNKTSGLQLNSLLYRFHPAVLWSKPFPQRDEILKEIRRIWKEYQLEPRTRLNTPVRSVKRVKGTGERLQEDPSGARPSKWIVNDGEDGEFDAVVVTVGTCGEPMRVGFPGLPSADEHKEKKDEKKEQSEKEGKGHARKHSETHSDVSYADVVKEGSKHEGDKESASDHQPSHDGDDEGGDQEEGEEETFEGEVVHSSELDDAQLEGKRVLVIGSGASGVEAVETALDKGAKGCVMIARDDKWIIPRNMVLDTLISAQPFGREMPLSFVWERVVAWWNYRGARELVPARLGLFEGTPVVNDEFVGLVKEGKCEYVRGDIERFGRRGVRVRARGREERPGEGRELEEVRGDEIDCTSDIDEERVFSGC
ncbi:FAD/NAD(P)-binding domain-containing protein [Trametes cingulata]|nr:FAD/NAD(P)-binding domain-containing protein [Trametes cingulata]